MYALVQCLRERERLGARRLETLAISVSRASEVDWSEVDARLVVQDQLILSDGGAQFAHHGEPTRAVSVLIGVVNNRARCLGFRFVHGDIGASQQ